MLVLLVAPRVFRAPEGPAAREASVLTSFGAAPRSPPVPSGPSSALHTSDAYCAHVLSWPHRHPRAPQPGPPIPPAPSTPVGPVVLMRIHIIAEPTPNFARNSPTTASSFEFRPLELQRFQTSLKLHSIELRATFLEGRPRHCPRRPQPGPPSLRHPPQLWGLLCSRVALTPLPPTGTAAWPIGVAAKPHPNPTSLTSSLHTQFRT